MRRRRDRDRTLGTLRVIGVLAWIGVGVFGGLGALARYVVDRTVSNRRAHAFPFGTLVVNGSGAFVLGLLVGAALAERAMLVFGTGFLGGYTTFSTWMVESERLAEDGQHRVAWLNLLGSIGLGLGLAGLGWFVGAELR